MWFDELFDMLHASTTAFFAEAALTSLERPALNAEAALKSMKKQTFRRGAHTDMERNALNPQLPPDLDFMH